MKGVAFNFILRHLPPPWKHLTFRDRRTEAFFLKGCAVGEPFPVTQQFIYNYDIFHGILRTILKITFCKTYPHWQKHDYSESHFSLSRLCSAKRTSFDSQSQLASIRFNKAPHNCKDLFHKAEFFQNLDIANREGQKKSVGKRITVCFFSRLLILVWILLYDFLLGTRMKFVAAQTGTQRVDIEK